MANLHRVDIHLDKFPAGRVMIDGMELKGISNLDLHYGADCPHPTFTITLTAESVTARIDAELREIKNK